MIQLLLFNITNGLIIGAFYVLMALGLSLILTQQSQIYATEGASKNDRTRLRFFCNPRSCCSMRISNLSPARSGLRATPVRLT